MILTTTILINKKSRLNKETALSRNDWIRTNDHLDPIQVLYQTEPHSECQHNLDK